MEEPAGRGVMGSDSDWPVMCEGGQRLRRVRGAVPGRRRSGTPHARGDALEFRRTAPRIRDQGDHRRRRWCGPSPGDAAVTLLCIGVPVPLAKLDGLDSLLSIVRCRPGPGGDCGYQQRPATQGCWRCGSWRLRTRPERPDGAVPGGALRDMAAAKARSFRSAVAR